MRGPPPDELPDGVLIASVAHGWDLEIRSLDYAPKGGGSYHWVAGDGNGELYFVTADDLNQKPWLGDTRETAFAGLRAALDTAAALRRGGLGFVVAPIPARQGETARRIGQRHSVSLFPFVDGQAGTFGRYHANERAAVESMLAELHAATPSVRSVARTIELELPGRHDLESAIAELGDDWSNGPFSEPARRALADRAEDLAELLALADRLAKDVASESRDWVVTHGEPHAGNVMRAGATSVLVDWDTVALAPPERDLWMIVSHGPQPLRANLGVAGRELDPAAVAYFRLRWDLTDIAAFTAQLRSPHSRSPDTEKAYAGLVTCLATKPEWAAWLT